MNQTDPVRHIYRWDLDKTYLDTDLRLHRVWRVPFEKPEEKRNVPGAVALLHELSSGQDPCGRVKISFISGSPRQMRRRIEEKFRLDGLVPDDLHLKPNLENFVSLRWRAIRDQVGYKLPLLLESRIGVDPSVHETCFGDDSESDALIYSMYADLVSGEIGENTLIEVMEAAGAYPDAVVRARNAHGKIQPSRAVQSIFIHLSKDSPPERFHVYGPRVIPVLDYFQAALCLYGQGRLRPAGVIHVAHELMSRYRFSRDRLAYGFQDILRRGFVRRRTMRELGLQLQTHFMPPPLPPTPLALQTLRALAADIPEEAGQQPDATRIDYPALIVTLDRKVRQDRRT